MKNRVTSLRFYINITLIISIIALSLWLYAESQKTPLEPQLLPGVSAENIQEIRFERIGQDTILLQRDADSWLLEEPYASVLAASNGRVNELLKLLSTPSHANYASSDLDLAAFGLDKPLGKIKFNDHLLFIGKTNPVNRYRYIRLHTHVHLVDDNLRHLLSADAPSFVGPHLLPQNQQLVSIKLADWELSKTDLTWTLKPENPDISSDTLQTMFTRWQRAMALWAKPSRKRPVLANIELQFANQESIHFELLSNDEQDFILARPNLGLEYYLDTEQGKALLELREPEPAPEDLDAAEPAAEADSASDSAPENS